MTYEQALACLESCENFERTRAASAMGEGQLARMRRLCDLLGNPQRRFRSILVAGTNGKGSICAMVYSILRESPLRVGLYTSPHVEDLRERIRVWTAGPGLEERVHGEDWIEPEEFAARMAQVWPVVEELRHETPAAAPTYFEVLTAVALLQFSTRGVDVAVLEVGLGGRLDATNVVDQAVSVIGPVDVDHAELLGATPARIAEEKSAIITPGQVVLTAPQSSEVAEVIRRASEAQAAPLWAVGRDLTVAVQQHSVDGLALTMTGLRGLYDALELPLIGRHQAENAALAVGAVEALSTAGVPYSIVEQGLAKVEWPGRAEVVHDTPLVIMDGAHNPHAFAALAKTLTELCRGRRLHLLVGMSSDKSADRLGSLLGRRAASITCTQGRHPRAMEPRALATALSAFCPDIHVLADPADAYTYALNAVSAEDVIVVTGSLFFVGELRGAIRVSHVRARRQSPVS